MTFVFPVYANLRLQHKGRPPFRTTQVTINENVMSLNDEGNERSTAHLGLLNFCLPNNEDNFAILYDEVDTIVMMMMTMMSMTTTTIILIYLHVSYTHWPIYTYHVCVH